MIRSRTFVSRFRSVPTVEPACSAQRRPRPSLRRHDLPLVWRDKDFNGFWLVIAGAGVGFDAFRWTDGDQNPGADPLRPGARRAGASTADVVDISPARRRDRDCRCATERAAAKPRFRTRAGEGGSAEGGGALPRCLGRGWDRARGRTEATHRGLAVGRSDLTGRCCTYGASRTTRHQRTQRLSAVGYPSRLRGCQGVTYLAGSSPLHARSRQPKLLTRSLACCHSPHSVPLTPKSLVHKALSRIHRHNRPKMSGGSGVAERPDCTVGIERLADSSAKEQLSWIRS